MKIWLLSLVLASSSLYAQLEPIPLWPGTAPGETNAIPDEVLTEPDAKGISRIKNVSVPTLTVYPAPADKRNGTAVVVAPGGGYSILAWQHEGTMVAEWLNDLGVTAILLKYRVPRRVGREKHDAPLEDAQRAMRMVRANAKEWNIDPKRIGFLGFSAGGHLTAVVGTTASATYTAIDAIDTESFRPDFLIPVYPAYLLNKEQDALMPEISVDKKTPPTFLVVTNDDADRDIGAAEFYIACKKNKVPAELHILLKGGHGYGMMDRGFPVNQWPTVTADWMKAMGLLKAK